MANTNVANRFDALRQQGIITTIGTGISSYLKLPAYTLAATVVVVEEMAPAIGHVVDTACGFASEGAAAFEGALRASNRALGIKGTAESFDSDAEILARKIFNACKGK